MKSFLPNILRKVPFVKTAPTKSGEPIPLHISKMTIQHVKWWHSNVQPVIDERSDRADRHWNWILIAAASTVSGKFLARKPVGVTVGIEKGEHFIPVVLIQLIGKFPYFINHKKKSVFVWYLSVAPDDALLNLTEVSIDANRIPKRMGSIALDIAVTYSANHFRKGRTSLHASIEGGEKLLNWYASRGMNIYPENEKLHFGFRRLFLPSDGRYCYFTEQGASKELNEFNPLR